jgi:hypothetical protein
VRAELAAYRAWYRQPLQSIHLERAPGLGDWEARGALMDATRDELDADMAIRDVVRGRRRGPRASIEGR